MNLVNARVVPSPSSLSFIDKQNSNLGQSKCSCDSNLLERRVVGSIVDKLHA